VYDSRDVVHALGHGRAVLLGTVVHVQQSGQRQYVSAGDPDRRQFGQLLVPGVRRYGGPERVERRADGVHARPFAGVRLDPPGPRHVFAVPGRGRGGRRSGGRFRDRAWERRRRRRRLRRRCGVFGGGRVQRRGGVVGWSRRGPMACSFCKVQGLRFRRRRRQRGLFAAALLRQRQYPVHITYVVEQPEAHVRRRLVAAAPRPERRTGMHVDRPQHAGRGRGSISRPAGLGGGRTPVPVVGVVQSFSFERPAAVVAISHRRHVHAGVFTLVGGRRVRFPLDCHGGHHLCATRRRRRVVHVVFSRICETLKKETNYNIII